MSSRTSSRSTLTTVPSTMSPSLKYLMVSSIAARNASSEPMSSMATLGVVEAVSVLLVMLAVAPVDWDVVQKVTRARGFVAHDPAEPDDQWDVGRPRTCSLPRSQPTSVHRTAYAAGYRTVQPSRKPNAPSAPNRPSGTERDGRP